MSCARQLSFFDTFVNLTVLAETNVTRLFRLIAKHVNISRFIPVEFYHAFYKRYGRKHKTALLSFLNALLVKDIFKIPTVRALIIFINSSPDCAAFCNLSVAPDETKFSYFTTHFSAHIKSLFDNMAQFVIPLCQDIDFKKASSLIFDITGVNANVHENNPKFVNSQIKAAKKLTKNNPDFNPHAYVYSRMPKTASAKDCPVNLSYVNGSFTYAHRFGILTNALGIPLDIVPLKGFLVVSDDPLRDKELSDSAALRPVISGFLNRHPEFARYSFIGDAAFDNNDAYDFLLGDCGFKRAIIPINPRATKFDNSSDFNEHGVPFCKACNKPFKFVGASGGKNRAKRLKFLCPLSFHDNKASVYSACNNPCTDSNCRARYVSASSNRRLYPGDVLRGSQHFDNIYKQRTAVERTIFSLKSNYSTLSVSSSRNADTVFSNLLFGGIAMLSVLILAKILSLKSLKSFNQVLKAA